MFTIIYHYNILYLQPQFVVATRLAGGQHCAATSTKRRRGQGHVARWPPSGRLPAEVLDGGPELLQRAWRYLRRSGKQQNMGNIYIYIYIYIYIIYIYIYVMYRYM